MAGPGPLELFPPEPAEAFSGIAHLELKIDFGETRAFPQYAFDTARFVRFIDPVRHAGIEALIVRGIMPVTKFAGLKRFFESCGGSSVAWLGKMLEGLDVDPRVRDMVATGVAVKQCRRLADAGTTGFHIHIMYQAGVSLATCRAPGLPIQTGKTYAA